MKVKKLIRELKKMPQNLEVGTSMGDNSVLEIAGWVNRVVHESKDSFDPESDPGADKNMINNQPDEWVSLRC